MNVQVNTDHNIIGSEELNHYITKSLSIALKRVKVAITRIEVHLSDENGGKTKGMEKRCLLEARIPNHHPIVVSHYDSSIHQAIETASSKLLRALNHMTGKLTDRKSIKDMIQANSVEEDLNV